MYAEMRGAARDPDTLRAHFRAKFGHDPAFLAQAPGRVNLIGEHIDYVGLPVLPFAIDRRVVLLAAPRTDGKLRLANTDPYAPREVDIAPAIPPFETADWGNYPRAAAQALAGRFGALRGLDALVASDLPPAAGLASSSALVVATALALLHVNELEIPPLDLATLLAKGERTVGLAGGGMDQAIALLAKHGSASRIEFDPVRATSVPVPEGWRFVVADSLQSAEKSGTARDTYNRRTEEAEAARRAVADTLETPDAAYAELIEGYPTGELLAAARETLDPTLLRRFRHIVTEAERVTRAERAVHERNLVELGGLLDASQTSLREDYGVSTDRLDRLVALAVRAGATGARLTGAGMGGCIIAACEAGRAPGVLAALERDFYGSLAETPPPEDRVFVVEPSAGAGVVDLEN